MMTGETEKALEALANQIFKNLDLIEKMTDKMVEAFAKVRELDARVKKLEFKGDGGDTVIGGAKLPEAKCCPSCGGLWDYYANKCKACGRTGE